MRENVDPNTIEDEGLRQVVMSLMNLVEELCESGRASRRNPTLARREQSAQGGTGQAEDEAQHKANTALSSEKERRVSKAAPEKSQSRLNQD